MIDLDRLQRQLDDMVDRDEMSEAEARAEMRDAEKEVLEMIRERL